MTQQDVDLFADVNCQDGLPKKSFKQNDTPKNPQYNPDYGKFSKYNFEGHESYETQRIKELARNQSEQGNILDDDLMNARRNGKVLA